MPSTLLDRYAAALRARSLCEPTEADLHRAAILLADFVHCRDSAPIRPAAPSWADSAIERAAGVAIAARTADRDDVHWGSLSHPGSIIWPIVTELGAATGVSGRRRLGAALAGYAAMVSLAAALGPEHGAIFHSTATAGTVGAAAATAVLLELADARWSHALGHALSAAGGSRGALIEDSGTRSFHSGHAVRTGIAAALAAARGLDATRGDLDRRAGVLATLDPDRLDRGDDAALVESSLRVFPTSGWNQAAYEAAFGAAHQAGGRIDRIVVRTPGASPPGLVEAVTAAMAAADPDRFPGGLPDVIEIEPNSGITSVYIAAVESADVSVTAPLDHPSRPAALARLATLKWHCSPSEAADRVTRITTAFTEQEVA